jgi:hypothetical protein
LEGRLGGGAAVEGWEDREELALDVFRDFGNCGRKIEQYEIGDKE